MSDETIRALRMGIEPAHGTRSRYVLGCRCAACNERGTPMWRRSTQEERNAAFSEVGDRFKRGEITQHEGVDQMVKISKRFERHDDRVSGLWTMVVAALLVGLALVAVSVARAEPARATTCRYCPPVECITSAFCGSGCFCLKTDGASTGQCVPR